MVSGLKSCKGKYFIFEILASGMYVIFVRFHSRSLLVADIAFPNARLTQCCVRCVVVHIPTTGHIRQPVVSFPKC